MEQQDCRAQRKEGNDRGRRQQGRNTYPEWPAATVHRFENHAAAILVLALTLSGVSYAILMQVLC